MSDSGPTRGAAWIGGQGKLWAVGPVVNSTARGDSPGQATVRRAAPGRRPGHDTANP